MRFHAINLSILHVCGFLTGLDIQDWLIIFSFSITEELHFRKEIHKTNITLSVHFIKNVPYEWSRDWRVIETSSVNEAHNHLTAPSSRNYFRMSWKLSTTRSNKHCQIGISKISNVFNNVKMWLLFCMECNFLKCYRDVKVLIQAHFLYKPLRRLIQNVYPSTLLSAN